MADVTLAPLSAETVNEAVRLHNEAFHDSFSTRLGDTYVKSMLEWFVASPTGISVVALNSTGEVVGYVLGAPSGSSTKLTRDLGFVAARSLICRPYLLSHPEFRQKLLNRFRHLVRAPKEGVLPLPQLPQPTMGLFSIAVKTCVRGTGLGSALMQEFESQCQAARVKSLLLSVRDENQFAISLYSKNGWIRCPEPHEIGGAHYYAKILQS